MYLNTDVKKHVQSFVMESCFETKHNVLLWGEFVISLSLGPSIHKSELDCLTNSTFINSY